MSRCGLRAALGRRPRSTSNGSGPELPRAHGGRRRGDRLWVAEPRARPKMNRKARRRAMARCPGSELSEVPLRVRPTKGDPHIRHPIQSQPAHPTSSLPERPIRNPGDYIRCFKKVSPKSSQRATLRTCHRRLRPAAPEKHVLAFPWSRSPTVLGAPQHDLISALIGAASNHRARTFRLDASRDQSTSPHGNIRQGTRERRFLGLPKAKHARSLMAAGRQREPRPHGGQLSEAVAGGRRRLAKVYGNAEQHNASCQSPGRPTQDPANPTLPTPRF